MSYLTLTEAAAYASRVKGFTVEPASLLRAGIHGHLLIVAPFNGLMRNLSGHTNDDYVGLLVLAPSELLTIETEGQARITGAFGLDGKAAYSPQVIRTMAQLRVRVPDLDKFLPSLISLDTQPQATPEPGPVVDAPVRLPKALATGPTFTMKKAAMVEQHKHEWQSIERDMKDANRNGLDVAKAGAREWDEVKAIEWARVKGKLTSIDKTAQSLSGAMNSMARLATSRKHRLLG